MSHSSTNTSLHIRAAFDDACVDVFHSRTRRAMAPITNYALLSRFAQHYERLLALPRHARRSMQRQWRRTLAGVALLLALTPGAAFAATMNVAAGVAPDVNADGKCSLIEAIFNANNNRAMYPDCPAGSGTDTIILPVGSKQVLTNSVGPLPGSNYYAQGVPKIRSPIVIEGRGSTIERADGSAIDLMIAVETNGDLTLNETIVSGRPAAAERGNVVCVLNRGKLSISRSSLLRGYNPSTKGGGGLSNEGAATLSYSTVAFNGAWFDGGGIYNNTDAILIVNDSIVSSNGTQVDYRGGSGWGGGILNRGTLIVNNSIIVKNYVTRGHGGGINNRGVATLRNSVVAANQASIAGGIYNTGTLTVEDSVVSGNVVGGELGGDAGGIGNWGDATIVRSTIADNYAAGYVTSFDYQLPADGGGILSAGTMTIVNSTISGNRAKGYGGGILLEGGTMTLRHTTVTSNRADLPDNWELYELTAIGGGILAGSGTLHIERSLITGNQSQGSAPEVSANSETTFANNFNVFGASGKSGVQGFTPGPTDIVPTVAVSSVVMPLANNGGKGATHALAINSPALNAAPLDAKCPATDQRGNPRPQGVKCDIGSFEGSAVLCNGLVTTQVGTVNADTLTGTNGVDVIAGLNGNDTIRGLNGNDVICAGSGADKVYGGNNNDRLFGDSENDQLFGDAGNDALNGGTGTDKCNGGSGTDTATLCETRTSVP